MRLVRLLLFLVIGLPVVARAADPNELVFIFQKQKNPAQVRSEADRVAEYLSSEIGIPVKAQVPGDYAASVQALVSKKADIAYVDSIAFLLARRDGGARLLLAEERPDLHGDLRTDYDSLFVVRNDSKLMSMDDLVKQAKSLSMVFTSPTSTSGYVMAFRRLVKEGLLEAKQDPAQVFKAVSFGGSYAQALQQVIAGRGDVCAVSSYTMEGTAADRYLTKEQRSRLRVLARTPGVPTHVITARGDLSTELSTKITQALLKLGSDNPELLSDVYGTAKFKQVVEDKHVAASAEAVQLLGIPVDGLMKKKS